MSKYRFDISANGFKLQSYVSSTEKSGLDRCRGYMSKFQRQVANIPLRVRIHAREKDSYGHYHGKPYIYVKSMVKHPIKDLEANVWHDPLPTEEKPL
jgi:hypothetical protein